MSCLSHTISVDLGFLITWYEEDPSWNLNISVITIVRYWYERKDAFCYIWETYLSNKHPPVELCLTISILSNCTGTSMSLSDSGLVRKNGNVKISNLLNYSGEKLSSSHYWETEDTPQSSYLQSCVHCLCCGTNLTVIYIWPLWCSVHPVSLIQQHSLI